MAKHVVKCLYCGESFDMNLIEGIKVTSNRYAHKTCAEKRTKEQSKEEKDMADFYAYCKEKFGQQFDFVKTKKLAEGYIKKYNYTWTGMLKTLIYFFEVKNNSTSKAGGSIGIIPYEYQHAHDYYFSIWKAQQLNVNKKIENYIPEVIEIKIPPPVPQPKKRKRFTFLDREEEE